MSNGEEEWISASVALSMGASQASFGKAIIERATHGVVRAKAKLIVYNGDGDEQRHDNCDVPAWFWHQCLDEQNWDQGDFSAAIEIPQVPWIDEGFSPYWKAFGVTFAMRDIQTMEMHAADADSSQFLENRHRLTRRGRPSAADWEAVMVELARALYVGDLQPKMQADIEEAIADYLSRREKHPGESTIREHARPLWRAIQGEAGN